jgi:hypothetical protein
VFGILAFGVPIFLLAAGASAFLEFPYRVNLTPFWWLLQLLLWAFVGALYGIAVWHRLERQCVRHALPTP